MKSDSERSLRSDRKSSTTDIIKSSSSSSYSLGATKQRNTKLFKLSNPNEHLFEARKELSNGMKLVHFLFNPNIKRYSIRPHVNPIVGMIGLGLVGLLFLCVGISMIATKHQVVCHQVYPGPDIDDIGPYNMVTRLGTQCCGSNEMNNNQDESLGPVVDCNLDRGCMTHDLVTVTFESCSNVDWYEGSTLDADSENPITISIVLEVRKEK